MCDKTVRLAADPLTNILKMPSEYEAVLLPNLKISISLFCNKFPLPIITATVYTPISYREYFSKGKSN
jgi:hypothetical protein